MGVIVEYITNLENEPLLEISWKHFIQYPLLFILEKVIIELKVFCELAAIEFPKILLHILQNLL